MYVKPCGDAHFTLLFSHGNAVDLGQMCSFYYGLGFRLGCNVFSYDYSGMLFYRNFHFFMMAPT